MLNSNLHKGLLALAAVFVFTGALALLAIRHTKGDGAQASAAPAVIQFVKDPEEAPAFAAHDLTGKPISPADFKGKVVLLNFWATWCAPCREEIPELISLQTQFKDRLQIIAVSEDDDPPDKVLQFVQKMGMNYPVVMATQQISDGFGDVPALPTTFLIDPQGRVMQRHTGVYPVDTYIQEIRALTGQPVEARIETFADTGQVFLKNAANATDLPDVDLSGLTPEQKKAALKRMNAEGCTCGCKLTIAECRINDTTCPVSKTLAAQIVKDVAAGGTASQPPPSDATKPAGN
jgi:thiol-disulfide isomerase/thioredoxin